MNVDVHRKPGSLVRAAAGQQGRGRGREQLGHGALRSPRIVRIPGAVDFGDLPGPVHHGEPKVPADKVAAVRARPRQHGKDPEGRKILEAGAELLKSNGELGFVAADNRDYDNYRKFYRPRRSSSPARAHRERGHEKHSRRPILEQLGAGSAPHAGRRNRDRRRRRRADRAAGRRRRGRALGAARRASRTKRSPSSRRWWPTRRSSASTPRSTSC